MRYAAPVLILAAVALMSTGWIRTGAVVLVVGLALAPLAVTRLPLRSLAH